MQAQERVNILVVDDQPAKLISYEAVLSELGENLIKAGSARAALEILLKNDIAVILADVCMPELDGFELARMIRDHPRYRNTAIVFISAVQLDDFDRLRGYELGGVDYVPVPIIPELLRAKVKVFAELYRKTRQLQRLNAELERRVAERTAEIAAASARLQLALDVARLGTWSLDLRSGAAEWSEGFARILGYGGETAPSLEAWRASLHPDDAPAVEGEFGRIAREGGEYHQIYRCRRADGSLAWCEARGRADVDAEGAPSRVLGVLMDVSEHKRAEEQQRLMVQELHHRVKNSLTTVHAIASLTARSSRSVDAFFGSFSSRLLALSRTHTMLVSHDWQRINLDQLLSSELGSFDDPTGKRLVCSGPSIDLPSDLALSLGLAIHELTTNAVKHGSLSVPDGRVDVSWSLAEANDDGQVLELSWVERGGPEVRPPETRGFGSTLLERIFQSQQGAQSRLEFARQGLQFYTRLPCRPVSVGRQGRTLTAY